MSAGLQDGLYRKRSAHCFEGALFAAAALQFIGYKPLIVDMKAYNDDDHVIAVFQGRQILGSGCKIKFHIIKVQRTCLQITSGELIMSYFDFFFQHYTEINHCRSYSLPLDLTYMLITRNWATTDEDLEYIGDKLESLHHYSVVNRKNDKEISIWQARLMLKAGMLGSNEDGLFKPSQIG
ncbi:MAG: hypothetical protein MZV63_10885 [Marinilabiliales bacterium]|nr:hypothetical protein [Marinilabiliales bacterium]